MPLLRIFFFLILLSSQAYAAPSHGIAMFGEPKYKAGFTHFDYANPDAPKGGEIRYGAVGTFDSLNPHVLKGNPADGTGLLFDTLMASSADEPFSAYGLLAETIDVADDRGSVTFTLRKEAKWQDGTPVAADDVVFSFTALTTKGHPLYRSYYRDVKGVEKLASNKVKFTFADTTNRELPVIIGQLPIISKKYYDTHEFEKSTLEPPMGSGPYKVGEVKPGAYIIYKRDPNYWGKDLPVNKGHYNFDTVRYDYYRDDTVVVQAFKAGEYDLRQENISKIWATAYDDLPALKDGRVIKEEIPHQIPTGMQAFVMNMRRPLFADKKVREALQYTFDFEWANKQLFFNAYTRTKSYFSNSDFAARGLPEGLELALLEPYRDKLPPEVFTKEYNPPVSDGSGNIRDNLRIAAKLLDEAGWKIVNGKRVDPATGKPAEIEFLLSSASFERVVAPVIKNLEKLGIAGRMRTVDNAQYVKRLETFDFDVTVHVFAQSNSPGNEQINYWHSTKADVNGSQNYAGIKNPVVDAMVEKVLSAKTKEELIAATRALDRVLQWNYYVIPNWHIRSFRILYWNKFARPAVTPFYALGLDTWWHK